MTDKIIIGPNLMGPFTYQDLPIGCTFVGRAPFTIPTGMWRFTRPEMNRKTSPCSEACLAGEDIRGWIAHARDGDFEKACQTLLEENPFPGVCGRVCPHPCELSCNRGNYDEALSIQAMERFIGDWAIRQRYKISADTTKKKQRIAIVGAGPAGLTSAYYLARLGYDVKVYESLPELGGMLRVGIPEYRLPKAVLEGEIKRIEDLGVEMETDVRIGKDISMEKLKEGYDAVLLAVGFEESKILGISGEDNRGVYSGLEFLKGINQGQKPDLKGRVAVIGGGNVAIDCARSIVRLGKTDVHIFCIESRDDMPAAPDEVIEAEDEGVCINFSVAPKGIIVSDGRVQEIEFIKVNLGEPDERGWRPPIFIEGTEYRRELDSGIIAVGQSSDLSLLPNTINTHGLLIATDKNCMTAYRGIFAGGDVATQAGSVASAIASGKRAAIFMDQYFLGEDPKGLDQVVRIGGHGAPSMAKYLNRDMLLDEREQEVIGFESLNMAYFENQDREKAGQLSIDDRKGSFKEVNLTLSEEAALREADRCFTCGDCSLCDTCFVFCPDMAILKSDDRTKNEIDYQFCKGCGICVNECPRGYIDLEKER